MNEKILKLAYELHDLLVSTNEYLELKEKEKIMLEDKELSILFAALKEVEERYANEKKEDLFIKIHEIKYEIDINDLVCEYKNAYNKYMLVVDKITNIAFKDLIVEENIFNEIRKIFTK